MKGLLISAQLVLCLGIVARCQDFFPIDSYEMAPASEDYFAGEEETSRHDDEDDYYHHYHEYDARAEEDYPSYQENDALYDSPSRLSDRKQKRREYFDGLAKKVHSASKKEHSHHIDLMAGASGPRSDRTKRARLSDYDLYYPKRQAKGEDSRSATQPPASDFNFDDFLFTTSTPVFDPERPSPRFNHEKKARHYDGTRRPSSEFESKPSRTVEPRRPRFKDDSYEKSSYSVEPRMPAFREDSYDNIPYSAQPRRPSSGFKDDSYSKPSHSVEPRRPSSGFTYQGEPLDVTPYEEPRYPSQDFKPDSYRKPSPLAKPHKQFPYPEESLDKTPEFKDDYYGKPSHFIAPRRPSSGIHTDSFVSTSRRPPVDDFPLDFDTKDGPSSGDFPYPTESYPNLSSKESYFKKPAKKIRQRSKRIELDPPLSHTLRSEPADPLDKFFVVPKDSSSRSARRPMRVKSSSPKKLTDVHGRSALYDDEEFPSKPTVVSFKHDRRRPGLFTEENRHYLAATGYGKPVREQFHEQGTTGPHSYKFGYNTGDKDNPMARYEERSPDGLVKGSYSYVDPLGKLKVVHYESHPDHGFKTTL